MDCTLNIGEGLLTYQVNFFTSLGVLCGLLAVTNRNPIVSMLLLIGLYLSVAARLVLTGVNFIGLSYILVYVGAISILFLFVLMLMDIRVTGADYGGSIILSMMLAFITFFSLYKSLTSGFIAPSVGLSEWAPICFMDMASIGSVLYTENLLLLLVASFTLLLGMVGAISITVKV